MDNSIFDLYFEIQHCIDLNVDTPVNSDIRFMRESGKKGNYHAQVHADGKNTRRYGDGR